MTTLDERLQNHARWMESACDRGERLVLVDERHPGVKLDGLDLTGAWLYGCDLTGASLRDTWLSGALLHGCILDEADLTQSRLSKAEGEGVSAQGATLVNADLTRLWAIEWNLAGADLTRCYLLKAAFVRCDLTGVRLVDADLDRTSFGASTVVDVDASGAAGTLLPLAEDGADPAGLVDVMTAAGATDLTLFDPDTVGRDDLPRWRHPLSTTPPD